MGEWSDDEKPAAKPQRQPRAGDWKCLSCEKTNFGNRTDCFSCHEDKGDAVAMTGDESSGGGERPQRQPRAGDWKCLSCSKTNFGNRTDCFSCHEDKGDAVAMTGDESSGGGERKQRQGRPDDWKCLSCSKTNFSNRTECFSCNEPKGEAEDVGVTGDESGGGERPQRQPRPGDWNCIPCGKNNFAGREECFSCNEPKGEAVSNVPVDPSEKPREIYNPPEPTNDENEMFSKHISAGINFDKFDKIDISVTGDGSAKIKPISSFASSGLREFLQENVKRSGYMKPTPIQKYAIPIVMANRDLMGCAQTGSGKTAAFILPILNTIMEENSDMTPGQPQCLIVAPTRELAIQIFEEARKFAIKSWVKIQIAYGGTASKQQGENVGRGCHILVATPGRLMDFVNKTIVTFESLKFLVLDEADRMLDMGFKENIEQIVKHETIKKDQVQTLMFSATFPSDIQRLAAAFLRNYIFLTVGIVGGASTDVEQEFIEVSRFKKRNTLSDVLKEYCNSSETDRILVFVETKRTADFLASYMSETSISTTSIHGDRLQSEREKALNDFRKGTHKVLIATSVAARGLDIKGVTHVINYDLPTNIQDYVHRIGRTGRVGNRGKSTSFYVAETDGVLAGEFVRILKEANQPIPEFLGNSSASTVNGGSDYGGKDIRKGVSEAEAQEEDEGW